MSSSSISNNFDESRFKNQVNSALQQIKKILDNTREPPLAEDVSHSYQDKYFLSEFLTNSSLRAQSNCFDILGINSSIVGKLKEWSKTLNVSLRFKGEEKCEFVREETRKEESKTQYVSERESSLFGKSTRTDKIITTITEYFWKFTVNYEIIAFQGTNINDCIILRSKTGEFEIKTSSNSTPKPKVSVLPDKDINITWFLHNFNDNLHPNFNINRSLSSCRTPRRNNDIYNAFDFFNNYFHWCNDVETYFRNRLFPVQTNHGLDLSSINNSGIFIPIIPLFDNKIKQKQIKSETPGNNLDDNNDNNDNEQSIIIPLDDIDKFMFEQKRGMDEKLSKLAKTIPAGNKLITHAEASIILSLMHSKSICQYFIDGVNYIESMLRKQLISAIGKEVQPADLIEYMEYHNRKLFKEEYAPEQFCYAIRRPNHYPEGILSIESQDGNPIPSLVHKIENNHPMNFSINAATTITFNGPRYIHAWIDHTFSGSTGTSLRLCARARQFSSFILIIGNIISANSFNPKHAIIIQNKDDLLIPLLLETIPTPKAFRDAIESLSPEQQRFAKAFRSMQLESTLFGVCIIQIKPQLEKLLNLSNDSLTKEIKLTQDLMELFIEYQVPSDLLSFDGHENTSKHQKLERVKHLVSQMQDMIQKSKERELEEARKKAEYELQLRLQKKAEELRLREEQERKRMESLQRESKVKYRKKSSRAPVRSAAPMNLCKSSAPAPLMNLSSAVQSQQSLPQRVPSSKPVTSTSSRQAVPSKPSPAPEPSKVVEAPKVDKAVENQQDNNIPKEKEEISKESKLDFTKLPSMLDSNFEALDLDSALHSTIIKAGNNWTKKYQKALLSKPSSMSIDSDTQKEVRNSAFDLLDGLSRSGVLDIDEASFHVVLAATHSFDKTLIETLIQDNINPIEKLERSMLIIASTIQEKSPEELINENMLESVKETSPNLF